MSPFKPQTQTPDLDKAIAAAFVELSRHHATSDEYSKTVDQLEKLYKIKSSYEKDNKRTVSLDQMLAVAGNLAGIVLILSYEHMHPITSKALGFVLKSKV